MSLKEYHRKRNFDITPEPKGDVKEPGRGDLRFVIQLHDASRLHYDFRIEAGGVFKSWAVPKGPTLDPSEQHLAVQVEDHPLEYGEFEGIIPKGNYGAGTVMVWDEGTYIERHSTGRQESEEAILKGIEARHVTLILKGKKLQGEFALVGLKGDEGKPWLLIKKRDQFASRRRIPNENLSVKTGRTLKEIEDQAKSKGEIWLPARTKKVHKSSEPPNKSPSEVPGEVPGKAPGEASGEKKRLPPPSSMSKSPSPNSRLKEYSKPQPEKLPKKIHPMLPVEWSEPFEQEGWIFEPEYGGVRAIAEIERGIVRLYSRKFLPFEKKYPAIVNALGAFKAAGKTTGKITAVLDGEIANGIFWVRDLLHLEGFNLRHLPLLERKRRLSELKAFNAWVRFSPHSMQCSSLLDKAESEGFQSILARDAYSTYSEGTSKQWLRIPLHEKDPDHEPRLTHLDKVFWPKEKITKGDLVEYYRKVAPLLLPFLKDRPESMHRHPNGVSSPGFFHKDLIEHHPRWVKTERIYSESVGKSINYLLCQNESTLLYIINLGCIEINPWLSRVGSLSYPDFIVIDLDPDDSNKFSEVVEIAKELHRVLDLIQAPHYCKTSGATGLHIYIPTQGKYDYIKSRHFALEVCRVIHKLFPNNTSLERNPAKRRGRIYLDCFQNAEGQTVAAPYCVRPRPKAPVSTPLLWKELNTQVNPEDFTLHTVPKRIEKLGDIWQSLLLEGLNIDACLLSLGQNFPIEN